MTWKQAQETALLAMLLAVLLLLCAQVDYYIRHTPG